MLVRNSLKQPQYTSQHTLVVTTIMRFHCTIPAYSMRVYYSIIVLIIPEKG